MWFLKAERVGFTADGWQVVGCADLVGDSDFVIILIEFGVLEPEFGLLANVPLSSYTIGVDVTSIQVIVDVVNCTGCKYRWVNSTREDIGLVR